VEHVVPLVVFPVALCGLDLLGQTLHDVSVDRRVDVRRKDVQDPPVSDGGLAGDLLHGVQLDGAVVLVQRQGPEARQREQRHAVQHQHAQDHRQDHEPEPDRDEDLLIEYVERQQAEGVVPLDGAGGSKLVEGALCHAREHVDHRVHSLSLVHL